MFLEFLFHRASGTDWHLLGFHRRIAQVAATMNPSSLDDKDVQSLLVVFNFTKIIKYSSHNGRIARPQWRTIHLILLILQHVMG